MSTTDEQPTDEEIISAIDSTGLVCPDVGLAIELVRIGVSMEAAPVDARDALAALANINDLACFASEEDTSTQAAVLLQIGHIARVAIQGQA